MTVIVLTAEVEKKNKKNTPTQQQNNNGAQKAHVCRRPSFIFCCDFRKESTQQLLKECDEIRGSALHALAEYDKVRVHVYLSALHVFKCDICVLLHHKQPVKRIVA